LRESVRQSNKDWALTEQAFARFLACLDPDPALAGEKYEALREALVKFLDWRGALFPDELVDEAFNRWSIPAMAERLGIPLNALRSRTQRIRNKLERCIMRCCKENNFRPT
jgi:DNA-directed RNA polymerase specialized sigma24 family protein